MFRVDNGARQPVKHQNKCRILQALRAGPRSRGDIMRDTGLSPVTVTSLTQELVREGLVIPFGTTSGRVGRRAMRYSLAPGGAYFLGLDIAVGRLTCVLLDLTSRVVAHRSAAYHPSSPWPDVLRAGLHLVDQTVQEARAQRRHIYGLGVAIPGIWDSTQNLVLMAPSAPFLEGLGLDRLLAQATGLPTTVVNDANACAYAEMLLGAGRRGDNLVYLFVDSGIGVGIISNGELLGGVFPSPGEIGHIIVRPDGPQCRCGKQGCLEVCAGYNAISRAVQAGVPLEAALQESAVLVGGAVAILVDLLAPRAVVMGGRVVWEHGDYWTRVVHAARQRSLQGLARNVQFMPGRFGPEVAAVGAACTLMEEAFRTGSLLRNSAQEGR